LSQSLSLSQSSSDALAHPHADASTHPSPTHPLRPYLTANSCALHHRTKDEFRPFYAALARTTGRDPTQLPSRRYVVRLGRTELSEGRDTVLDELLCASLGACRVREVLVGGTVRLEDGAFVEAVGAQLSLLADIVSELLSNKWLEGAGGAGMERGKEGAKGTNPLSASNGATHPPHPYGPTGREGDAAYYRHVQTAACTACNRELDAVCVLEWVTRAVVANAHRAHLVWPKMHGTYHD
jgi:hypothetical protein